MNGECWDPVVVCPDVPWGASPGPGEMQALLCFESVIKRDHTLGIFTK